MTMSPMTRIDASVAELTVALFLPLDLDPPNLLDHGQDPTSFSHFFLLESTINPLTMSLDSKGEGAGVSPQNKGSWSSFLKVVPGKATGTASLTPGSP